MRKLQVPGERGVALRPTYRVHNDGGAECNPALHLIRRRKWREALTFTLLALALPAISADPPPKAPVPPSPYLPVIYRFADAMLEHARDTHGPQKTGLFLSALDRKTLQPLTVRPAAPAGVREDARAGPSDGPLTGANLQHDENLLRVLYTLSELSSKPVYRDATDAAVKWFLENTAAPATNLFPWGQRLAWDVVRDEVTLKGEDAWHEFLLPWLLWDRCFELAPEPSKRFALGLWDHQIDDHETGAFDLRCGFNKHAPKADGDFPQHAGYYIRTWATAYAHTKDARFLHAVEVLLERFEKKRHPKSGRIEVQSGGTLTMSSAALSLAIDCDGAAHRVPEPLASRLHAFALREDEVFCSLPHDLKGNHGFVVLDRVDPGFPEGEVTPLWDGGSHARCATAQLGLMCQSRYENAGNIKHRDLMIGAAEAYLTSSPPEGADTWPMRYGHAISLHVAAWRHTARAVHLDAARRLADDAVAKFFDTGPLPRASVKSDHYEALTGAGTLALALVELHLNILHITAVRAPPNTIDR